jgi:hypothetical protein
LAAQIAGKAVQVTGQVLIRNEDSGAPKMRQLQAGDVIEQGSVINTGSASTVKILLEDRTIVDLSPSTLFKVNEYLASRTGAEGDRKVALSMGFGKVRASVNTPVGPKGKFTIRSRSVTMGVRGTEFVVESELGSESALAGRAVSDETGKTQLTVVHGKVEVHDGRSGATLTEPLTAGMQLVATTRDKATAAANRVPAAETQVAELPKPQVEEIRRDAKQEMGTFMKAVALDRSGEKSSGSQTLAAIAQNIALPSNYVPSVGEMGFPGTFGSDFGLNANVNQMMALPVRVRVVFVP